MVVFEREREERETDLCCLSIGRLQDIGTLYRCLAPAAVPCTGDRSRDQRLTCRPALVESEPFSRPDTPPRQACSPVLQRLRRNDAIVRRPNTAYGARCLLVVKRCSNSPLLLLFLCRN